MDRKWLFFWGELGGGGIFPVPYQTKREFSKA